MSRQCLSSGPEKPLAKNGKTPKLKPDGQANKHGSSAAKYQPDGLGPHQSRRGFDEQQCSRTVGELSKVELHVLWRETGNRLDTLWQCVREAKRVDEASNFCRWLQFSGVLQLLKRNPADFPLQVDGAALERKAKDILSECGELYAGGKHDAKYAASDIAEINRKLDALMSERKPASLHLVNSRTWTASGQATAAARSAAPVAYP